MAAKYKEEISINLIHYPVYTLGVGLRVGIWFQGCSIRCKGCISTHTWKKTAAYKTTVKGVLDKVLQYRGSNPDGITISGGEPFDQPDGLYALLKGLRESGFKDIMLYSGYGYDHLKEKYPRILDLMDVLIDGRFVKGLETEYIWKGSDNQEMIILTKEKMLIERYIPYKDKKDSHRGLQVIERGGKIYILGIPKQKDSEVLKNGFS